MNVTEARNLFRDYVDDPDGTFLTDAQVNQYLDFGLGDWLKFIRQHRPDLLLSFVNLTAANGAGYTSQPTSSKPVAYALNLNDKDIIYPGKVANTPLMGSFVDTTGGAGAYVTLTGPIDTISNLYKGQAGPDSEQTRTWRLMPVSRGESLLCSTVVSLRTLLLSISRSQEPFLLRLALIYRNQSKTDFCHSSMS